MTYAWLIAAIAFALIEMFTAQLVSVWFIAGALASLIASMLGVSTTLQWILFIAVSAVTLIATRPLVKKITSAAPEKTNADANIGKSAIVTDTIDNLAGTGSVKLGGISWTARSINDSVIPEGSTVTVENIEGVKLMVK